MNFSLKRLCRLFSFKRNAISFKDINNSKLKIDIYNDPVIKARANFDVSEAWLDKILNLHYDDEIKSKYIPELHQISEFERDSLNDLLEYNEWNSIHSNQIRVCEDYLSRFEKSYIEFYEVLSNENIKITQPESNYVTAPNELFNQLESIRTLLSDLNDVFAKTDFNLVEDLTGFSPLPTTNEKISSRISSTWNRFLDKKPQEEYVVRYLLQHYQQVYYNLADMQGMIKNIIEQGNCKIIAGNAGTGKTHISAHIIKELKANDQYVLFFKPKLFNGDNLNFEEKMLELLEAPRDHTFTEVLESLDAFSFNAKKRCVLIFDALNETTKSNIGFSNIWKTSLQSFINKIKHYPNLYVICTLRTSYIDHIWETKPSRILELKGLGTDSDIKAACQNYFSYYKIKPTNFDQADLSYFNIPLLLDLYCKLTNENRVDEVSVSLDINSYLSIFEDYISRLTYEVKRKLTLQKDTLIKSGFEKSSEAFLENNEAIISLNAFSDAFNDSDHTTIDHSIAQAVLEGYLIFIKDFTGGANEIIKHTQQEVGGYLIAAELMRQYPILQDLINSAAFQEKLVGSDAANHHQLRLDILKFLIAMQPDLIKALTDKDGINLSWWYLFNGSQQNIDESIPNYLLNLDDKLIVKDILDISSRQWVNPNHQFNFDFISKVLLKQNLWDFSLEWDYLIYKDADYFWTFVKENQSFLKDFTEDHLKYHLNAAKFISYISSTTITDLRDEATIYLIEFGKILPLSLLKLTIEASKLKDTYIYERLAGCCYGVALNLQNNPHFVSEQLPQMAEELFSLQFAKDASAPVFNYIVIDSIKHLLDLAILKERITFSEVDLERIAKYEFTAPATWTAPNDEQVEAVMKSRETDWPAPIGMDFGIYTIPRLLKEEDISQREAISHVYKRIYELGYRNLDLIADEDEMFNNFYWGHNRLRRGWSIERLGKKYSWMAFYDYAGYLLLNKHLNVSETGTETTYYNRLSDVSIDFSLPLIDYKIDKRLFNENLLQNQTTDPNWAKAVKLNSLYEFFQQSINGNNSTMLYGKVDQGVDDRFKVRSFILVESFFIKNDEDLPALLEATDIVYDEWKHDIHISRDAIRHTYFGELYWADTMPSTSPDTITIPTGKMVKFLRTITPMMAIQEGYGYEQIGQKIEEEGMGRIQFDSEPSLSEYLWESDSGILKGFSEYFPSVKMGKYLELKSDPKTCQILDSQLNPAFYCVHYKDDSHFNSDFNYMRNDLLKKYMADHDLSLVYQIKQHSYDDNSQNRMMKYSLLRHTDITV